jgi:hypothetical protein
MEPKNPEEEAMKAYEEKDLRREDGSQLSLQEKRAVGGLVYRFREEAYRQFVASGYQAASG